jgi:simple sugar transport system permease protein
MFRISGLKIYKVTEISAIKDIAFLAIALAISLLFGAVLISITKADPIQAYGALLKGSFGSRFAISQTMVVAIPLLFIGLGTTICFRCKVWNIGGNGQLLAGGIAATVVGLYLGDLPSFILIPLTILAGAVGGAICAGIVGLLRVKFNMDEIFVTIMMNYIVYYFSIFLLEEVWRESSFGMPWSEFVSPSSCWPVLYSKTRIHLGLVLGVVGLVYAYLLLFRSSLGYEIRAIGLNRYAAFQQGINLPKIILSVMVISGVLAGIAGAGQVCGFQHRFTLMINKNYGFVAIIVALLGRLTPLGVLFASIFLGALNAGAVKMQAVTGIPSTIVDCLQGIIIVAVIMATALSHYRIYWKKKNE